jgi:tRNA-dihydrouridine synthase
VTVKMRRGQRDGSRAFLAIGPRLVDAGAQALTLHPRSAQQMYTGRADHALTAELVEAVTVPVIASGDVTSRARAEAVLHTTGCAAVMIARAAQGNPWLLRELATGDDEQPANDEIVAELIRYARAVVHEIGERRAVPFLRKFHPWYLRRGTFPRTLRQELSAVGTIAEVEALLLAEAPAAEALLAADAAELADHDADLELGLPISVYGGG